MLILDHTAMSRIIQNKLHTTSVLSKKAALPSQTFMRKFHEYHTGAHTRTSVHLSVRVSIHLWQA